MKSSEFSKVGPAQFWPQPMIPLVWGQSCPQIPTFALEGTRKHPDYMREWTLLRCKSPPGPKLINTTTIVLSLKEKNLRVEKDREEQTPGVPSPCTITYSGCVLSPTCNSVWVCVFVLWKVHKGQIQDSSSFL